MVPRGPAPQLPRQGGAQVAPAPQRPLLLPRRGPHGHAAPAALARRADQVPEGPVPPVSRAFRGLRRRSGQGRRAVGNGHLAEPVWRGSAHRPAEAGAGGQLHQECVV